MTGEPPVPSESAERGVLPVVARRRAGAPTWLLVATAGLAAILLFAMLEARRNTAQAPPVQARSLDLAELPATITTLEIPPEPAPAPSVISAPLIALSSVPLGSPLGPVPLIMRSVAPPPPAYYNPPPPIAAPAVASGGPAVVIDTSTPGAAGNGQAGTNNVAIPAALGAPPTPPRVHAGKIADRSTTVTQGTLIHAVLETGFDSTRPGFARAIVSRDVRGFDGTRVLIPRGSRVIGEYQADVRPGEHRALIMWTRLIRPDGASIDIASPASDPVGRGGVEADVNSHFFERFSGAILQSALDVGVNLASRSADQSVVVALPNSGAVGGQLVQPTAVTPTLKVKPATSISIFVARDLDFTDVEDGS